MSESCREWRGDLAAAAPGNIEPGAEIALQAHLDGGRACRVELDELTEVATALPAADLAHMLPTSQPPAELGEQVLGRLSWERASERHRRRRRLTVAIATVVAAVAAIVAVFAMGASL